MPSRKVVIACAGAGKTTEVVGVARSSLGQRVLLLTYTTSNQRHLEAEVAKNGIGSALEVRVAGWIEFCINYVARPYQRSLLGSPNRIAGYNFDSPADRYAKLTTAKAYLDRQGKVYSDRPALLAAKIDELSAGAAIKRISELYSHILVDEVQDLSGYDLDLVERLFAAPVGVTLVGDPRQAILDTHRVARNRQYRGPAIANWLQALDKYATIVNRVESHRCRPEICKFASELFPSLPPMKSLQKSAGVRNGMFAVPSSKLRQYLELLPNALAVRYSKASSTYGVAAENIGVVKGRTVDHVLLFPTKPMLTYLAGQNVTQLPEPQKLYVAVTRARFSVTFVVPDGEIAKIIAGGRVSALLP